MARSEKKQDFSLRLTGSTQIGNSGRKENSCMRQENVLHTDAVEFEVTEGFQDTDINGTELRYRTQSRDRVGSIRAQVRTQPV